MFILWGRLEIPSGCWCRCWEENFQGDKILTWMRSWWLSQVFSNLGPNLSHFYNFVLPAFQTLMTAKYSRQHFCCGKLRRGRKKVFWKWQTSTNHILCENFLVRGRLADCDKLLYLSDLFDGRISSTWLCSQFLPDLLLDVESSGQILTNRTFLCNSRLWWPLMTFSGAQKQRPLFHGNIPPKWWIRLLYHVFITFG